MAKTFGSTLRQLTELRETAQQAQDSPDQGKREATMQKVQTKMSEFFSLLRELPRLERDPARGARFYATMLAETAGLDTATRDKLEPPLRTWITQLQRDSLALPQRPTAKEATADWDKRRVAAMQDISKQLQTLVPADKTDRASLMRALMIEGNEAGVAELFDMIIGTSR
jgi:hypothetical protein